LGDVWDDLKLNNLYLEGDVSFSNAKKAEHLIYRIIEMSTKENDIVLDYHLGSGTTAAVAHKMNRQYIGIEQMDYIETVAVERLKKVIEGEQGGISKAVNWQGGGEFVYVELKKYNQHFIDEIAIAKDTKEILSIWENMKAKSFLNYNIDIKKQEEHIEEFKKLTLEEQKQHLVSLLDKNQLYVNRSQLYDADYSVSEEEIALTKDFYQL
jgi:adenine-specific DNA-methyltransferase